MADTKKYYYMRLKENFFESDELIYLESLDEGYLFSNILLKLYLRSLKNEGVLMMNEYVPYDAKMISKFTGHSLSTVEKALFEFKKLALIELLDTGQMYMSNIELFVGKSSTEGDRKKIGRMKAQQKLLPPKEENGQMSDKCPPEKELELELEKELEKELNNNSSLAALPKAVGKNVKYDESSPYYGMAKYLYEKMLTNNPKAKEPNYQVWADDFRKIIELDERDALDVKSIIDFSQNDSFWCTNILSPAKLRKQYDQLLIKMNQPKQQFNRGGYQQNEGFKRADDVDSFKERFGVDAPF